MRGRTAEIKRPAWWENCRRKLTRKPGLGMQPDRVQDWEKSLLELDDLHVSLNHALYTLRQVLKAKTLKEAKQLAKEGIR